MILDLNLELLYACAPPHAPHTHGKRKEDRKKRERPLFMQVSFNRALLRKAYKIQTGKAGTVKGRVSRAFGGSFLSSLSHFHSGECFSFLNNLSLFCRREQIFYFL